MQTCPIHDPPNDTQASALSAFQSVLPSRMRAHAAEDMLLSMFMQLCMFARVVAAGAGARYFLIDRAGTWRPALLVMRRRLHHHS